MMGNCLPMSDKSDNVRSSQKGLTLLEVLIALMVFSIGILAVISMQLVSMDAFLTGRISSQNSVAAGNRMETLLMLPYDHRLLTDIDDGFSPESPDHGPFQIAKSRAMVQWEIDDDFPAPGTKRISVAVHQPTKNNGVRISVYEYVKSREFR